MVFMFAGEMLFAVSFLLVFAVVFALLSYSGIFTKKDKQGNVIEKPDRRVLAMISLAVGLVSAIYEPFQLFLQKVLPLITIGLIGLFFVVLVIKVFTRDEKDEKPRDLWPAMIALVILLFIAFAVWNDISAALRPYLPAGFGPDSLVGVAAAAFILIIFYFAYRMGKQPP